MTLTTVATLAVLPPRYQNANDLNVMVTYIKEHDRIITLLKSIDFRNHTVYYGDCKVLFGRKEIKRPAGMVGPVAPLEFKREICITPNQQKGKQ